MRKCKIIGITGSIASGKSAVSTYLANRGYTLYSTDKLGHEVLTIPEVIQSIVDLFGEHVLVNSVINRIKLGEVVFSNRENLAKLNGITHPQIFKLMQDYSDNFDGEFLFFEVPLLFEAKMSNMFDYILTVSVSEEIQVARLMTRDDMSQEEALKRVKSQMANQEKELLANYVINNSGSKENLEHEIDKFITVLDEIELLNITPFWSKK